MPENGYPGESGQRQEQHKLPGDLWDYKSCSSTVIRATLLHFILIFMSVGIETRTREKERERNRGREITFSCTIIVKG